MGYDGFWEQGYKRGWELLNSAEHARDINLAGEHLQIYCVAQPTVANHILTLTSIIEYCTISRVSASLRVRLIEILVTWA